MESFESTQMYSQFLLQVLPSMMVVLKRAAMAMIVIYRLLSSPV